MPVGQFWVHVLVEVKKYVLAHVVQLEADIEHYEQFTIHAAQVHVVESA